jgi:hypothetical protein
MPRPLPEEQPSFDLVPGADVGRGCGVAEEITAYVLTAHARFELARRGISEHLVRRVLAIPEQRISVRPGRVVLQSRTMMESRVYLVRVVVDVDRHPAEVVTAYRISKVAKYWAANPCA